MEVIKDVGGWGDAGGADARAEARTGSADSQGYVDDEVEASVIAGKSSKFVICTRNCRVKKS